VVQKTPVSFRKERRKEGSGPGHSLVKRLIVLSKGRDTDLEE